MFWFSITIISCDCDKATQIETKSYKPNLHNDKALEEEISVLNLEYYGWGCPCPQWISPANRAIYEENSPENLTNIDSFFYHIIPASDTVPNPFDLTTNLSQLRFQFTGRFFKTMQYMHVEGELKPAITLLYHKVELSTCTKIIE